MNRGSGGRGERQLVAEIQGLYGAFSVPEILLQAIWWRGDFDQRDLRLTDGRRLRIERAGKWNHLGGPDFQDAVLWFDGEKRVGDVEVHGRAGDWVAHGHAEDPAYARVILHVVLFPPERAALTAQGEPQATLVLLPVLHHDLEEYAMDAAIERLADHPLAQARDWLRTLNPGQARERLVERARERWTQKVGFARARVERFGWEQAAHQYALEILGYRLNRVPMSAVALEFPLSAWRAEPASIVAKALASQDGRWVQQGCRPANQPERRLQQYVAWIENRPEWPSHWKEFAAGDWQKLGDHCTASFREVGGMAVLNRRMNDRVCGGAVTGTRWPTLVVDGLLPLAAACHPDAAKEVGQFWIHWYCGDVPDKVSSLLRALQITGSKEWPEGNGMGQGLLAWLIAAQS